MFLYLYVCMRISVCEYMCVMCGSHFVGDSKYLVVGSSGVTGDRSAFLSVCLCVSLFLCVSLCLSVSLFLSALFFLLVSSCPRCLVLVCMFRDERVWCVCLVSCMFRCCFSLHTRPVLVASSGCSLIHTDVLFCCGLSCLVLVWFVLFCFCLSSCAEMFLCAMLFCVAAVCNSILAQVSSPWYKCIKCVYTQAHRLKRHKQDRHTRRTRHTHTHTHTHTYIHTTHRRCLVGIRQLPGRLWRRAQRSGCEALICESFVVDCLIVTK